MDQAVLDKILEDHKKWLDTGGVEGVRANLTGADLRYANLTGTVLTGTVLTGANLTGADLRDADLDFSAFPLWCGGLDVHIDDRQASQLLYHLLRNIEYSNNTSASMKKICKLKTLIEKANKFHRVEKCGKITLSNT